MIGFFIIVFILYVILVICMYVLFSQSNISSDTYPKPLFSADEVFNIPGNVFTYKQAPNLCKAYGARLATYDEVEKSYNAGGEWCNYGWSDKQMALFPTQTGTFNKLQAMPGHEHDCGRPGINGGYIANPNVRFGVNCYGKKMKMTDAERKLMDLDPLPISARDEMLEKQVEFWSKHISNILVSPFNYNKWSRY